MTRPLGKLPRKEDARTLRLTSVLRDVAVPSTWTFDRAYPRLAPHPTPMLGNDEVGNCGLVAAAHHQLGSEGIEHGRYPHVQTSDMVAEYFAMTGGADVGLYMLDVCNRWRQLGLRFATGRERIAAYGEVTPNDDTAMRRACVACRGLYLGLLLPLTAADQFDAAEAAGLTCVWTVVAGGRGWRGQVGSWGGHAVSVLGYTPSCWYVGSWGAVVKASWAFVHRYADECYGPVDRLDTRTLDVDAVTAFLEDKAEVVA